MNKEEILTEIKEIEKNSDKNKICVCVIGIGRIGLPTALSLPIQFIPANSSTIPASTPGTIINLVSPEVTISPIGTAPPPSIPLNSLSPTVFDQTPTLVAVT